MGKSGNNTWVDERLKIEGIKRRKKEKIAQKVKKERGKQPCQ